MTNKRKASGWATADRFVCVAKELEDMGYAAGVSNDVTYPFFSRTCHAVLKVYDEMGAMCISVQNPDDKIMDYVERNFSTYGDARPEGSQTAGGAICQGNIGAIIKELEKIGLSAEITGRGARLTDGRTKNSVAIMPASGTGFARVSIIHSPDGRLTEEQFGKACDILEKYKK